MTTNAQPTTNVKPLPYTQSQLLVRFQETAIEMQDTARMMIEDTAKDASAARGLAKKGLIVKVSSANGFTLYEMPTAPAAPMIDEGDELPAKMPREIAPVMDADTNPVMDTPSADYTAGDTIRYHHMVDPRYKHWIFTGEVLQVSKSTYLGNRMYYVRPQADDRLADLSPKWIMPHEIEGGHDPIYDQLPVLRQIEAAFAAWEQAYLAGRFEEAGKLSAIHDRLFDQHMARLFAKPVVQEVTPPTPDTSSTPVQTVAPALNESASEWFVRSQAREAHWAQNAIGPLPEPTKTTFLTLAPKKPMTPEQRASEDGLQALLKNAK